MEWLIPVIIVVALVVIVGIYLWATYNSLVTLNVRVDEAWSDITVQLKRRADLIPNLIEAVIDTYRHQRAANERFIDTVKRIGIDPFKSAANAQRRTTAQAAA